MSPVPSLGSVEAEGKAREEEEEEEKSHGGSVAKALASPREDWLALVPPSLT